MSDSTLQILEGAAAGSSSREGREEPIPLQLETAGRYLLRDLLGKGCMGEVWRAEDPQIGRAVAVKILRVPEGIEDGERTEWEARFQREARAAGGLSHPGIVAIHDVGKSEDGRPFIVMELIAGKSLEAIARDGPRPRPDVVLGWGVELAEALEAAHRRGIIHRDIKPANVLIDAEGRARIADFGIARLSESELTREGSLLGSPAYSAPEQIRGQSVDGRADLFSLGATLYAVLTGQRPFPGKDLTSAAFAVCYTDPAPPSRHVPGLPERFDELLLKSLAKDPARRHQSGRELAAEIRALQMRTEAPAGSIAVRGAVPRAATKTTSVPPAIRRRRPAVRWGTFAASIVAFGGIVIGAIALVSGSREPARSRRVTPARVAAEEVKSAVRRLPAPPLSPPSSPAVAATVSPATLPTERAAVRDATPLPSSAGFERSTRSAAPSAISHPPSRSTSAVRRPPAQAVSATPGPPSPTSSSRPSSPAAIPTPSPAPPESAAVVTVRVVHSLEDGELSIWSDDRLLLKESLRAEETDVGLLGSDIFTRRKGIVESLLKVPPGRRSLTVRVESGSSAQSLVKETTQQVDAGGRYTFEIHVRSFPRPHLSVDWEGP